MSKAPAPVEVHAEAAARFPPPKAFRAQANVTDTKLYEAAAADLAGFWASEAERLVWSKPWQSVMAGSVPDMKWFAGGQINASTNALDRHVDEGRGAQTALVWEGEPGDARRFTYRELRDEVAAFAGGLRKLGVNRGDRVTLYLPMIPELPVAMLACARIGAIHNVVFAGFSPQAVASRMDDAASTVLITCDGFWRGGQVIPQKQRADEAPALAKKTRIEHVVCVRRFDSEDQDAPEIPWTAGRDVWYDDVLKNSDGPAAPVAMEANDPLFIMYTSGSTGKPKGIQHSTGGYLVGAASTARWYLDLKPGDMYWCMADIGWITGHSYIVYGPLLVGAQVLMYEGAPGRPDAARPWDMVQRHGVQVLYTAPTAIRAFMRAGDEYPGRHDLSSLRLLGSVGEPIAPKAWLWYHRVIGGERCPIADTWWQTETGMHLLAHLPGVHDQKPGCAGRPAPGVQAIILDDAGNELGPNQGGNLTLVGAWPSMLQTIWNDHDRYLKQYWTRWGPRHYDAGDGAYKDEDGDVWILGRTDDVLNVSGHRLGTAELEGTLIGHPLVAEAAVVGAPHGIKGTVPVAFVVLASLQGDDQIRQTLVDHVSKEIGKIARPERVLFVEDLPKTRSGKIMRRLLVNIVEGRELGDTTTLADPGLPARIRDGYAQKVQPPAS